MIMMHDQDTSQDVVVATATCETLVKQKTFELRGLDARMAIYMQAHELLRTSGESINIVTIDKWVSDLFHPLIPSAYSICLFHPLIPSAPCNDWV